MPWSSTAFAEISDSAADSNASGRATAISASQLEPSASAGSPNATSLRSTSPTRATVQSSSYAMNAAMMMPSSDDGKLLRCASATVIQMTSRPHTTESHSTSRSHSIAQKSESMCHNAMSDPSSRGTC
jgi:hypothetical protein